MISQLDPDTPVATLDVAGNLGKRIWDKRTVTARDFSVLGDYREFTLNFNLSRETELKFRILVSDQAELWADCVRIVPVR